ncbi:hypothetical protein B0G93_102301 [Bacillus sp. V-88]|nr:hypothetical protein B0G93_102301 [Bacillus sp. V-88]SLK15964.1 hypothetical protein SAMN06295884_102301 [Bacillus sp. V-88]
MTEPLQLTAEEVPFIAKLNTFLLLYPYED